MMRKIGLNKRSLGSKKVSPPQVPGGEAGSRVSGVYSDSGLPHDAFNSSFESFSSGGASVGAETCTSYGPEGSVSSAPSPPGRPESLYGLTRAGLSLNLRQGDEHAFKEPCVPYRSASTVSSPTQEQSPTKGSRNSMSSIDSGWASNPVPGFSSFCSRNSNSSLNSLNSKEELEVRPQLQHQQQYGQRRLSTISTGPPPPKRQSSTSSFTCQPQSRSSLRPAGSQESVGSGSQQPVRKASSQTSQYSSSSSLGSSRNGEDCISNLNIRQMVEQGVYPEEVVHCWLADLRFQEYFSLFAAAGYDMPTISRMTPEDLTAIGIKKPHHRKKLTAEIVKLDIPDCLPATLPHSIDELISGLRLHQYLPALRSQGYSSVQDALSISIEDLEDIGFYQLGHQKRLLLGLRRVKDLKSGKLRGACESTAPLPYQPEEVTMCSLPPTGVQAGGHSKQSFSSFQQNPGRDDSATQLRFPRHPSQTNIPSQNSFPSQYQYNTPSQHPSLPHSHYEPSSGPPSLSQYTLQASPSGPPSLSNYTLQPHPSPPPPDMPSPMQPLNHSIPGLTHHLPPPLSPLPQDSPIYQHYHSPPPPQPSLWQQFPSPSPQLLQTTSVQIHRASDPSVQNQTGTLPRPMATVHPLPMEHDLLPPPDVHMPFANERSGTIKLKTSPTEAFAKMQAEEAANGDETKDKSLLKTPTRALNRSAGDVMEDISTMLNDLTDELDSMLCSDSLPE